MSSDAESPDSGLTRQDIFAVLGALGALVTIVTAVMLYFGWRRSDVQARAMGIDVSLFGFTTQDYVLRSISSLYLPILVTLGVVLAWLWLHRTATRTVLRARAGPRHARKHFARTYRTVAIIATALAVGSVIFTWAAGLSSPPWPIDPAADALAQHQWTVPLVLVVGTLTAAYAWWLHGQLTDHVGNGNPHSWQTVLTGTIVGATVVLGAFWMLEEYASAVGRRYASQIAASVAGFPAVTIVSPTPLGVQAPGVTEELVRAAETPYYRTTGLRLLARSGSKVILLPDNWTPGSGSVVVVADRDDLIWEFAG